MKTNLAHWIHRAEWRRVTRRLMLWGWAAWAAAALPVAAQIVSPLYLGNLEPVLNEYGRLIPGSRADEPIRSRVEIRTTASGVILPPATNGAAHPANPLLAPDSFGGMGMNAVDPNSGLFAMVFPLPPSGGTKLFARVYNAATAEEASFYADSTVGTVGGGDTLILTFGAMQPLDDGDDDGDGLHNSWERSLGIHERPGPDYDGDGMSDLQEWRAGTDLSDPDSLLKFNAIEPQVVAGPAGMSGAGSATVRVQWRARPGKRYQLEYLPALLGEPAPVPVGAVVTAGAEEYEIALDVELPEAEPQGVFRVRLVQED